MADQQENNESKPEESKTAPVGEIAQNVVGGRKKPKRFAPRAVLKHKIIRAEHAPISPDKVRVIGGDTNAPGKLDPPAIIIEKDKNVIKKIIVKCPCGRHGELVCEYES